MYDVKEWRHAFKLDPDKPITDEDLEKVCESGTDAVIIGGSDHIDEEDILNLMARVRRYLVPCVLEVSTLEAIVPGFDLYFIPTVLNSRDPKWIVELHKNAVKEYGELMDWDEMLVEGYCILNEDCKAAKLTDADTEIDLEDVKAYARMSENMFHLPVFYMEYSGTYGNPQWVQEVSAVLNKTKLFYGGGIASPEQAAEMGSFADTVIVGNIIYDDLKAALKTVSAVKS
ncbi:heptaprenylglyceryl phosphate synthase [Bacillus sp. FJAT-42376]|uniref:heptaprenylglyceryl phosphate synthase n=1 Tax=Bacillus sp. FJAT-42376 TaxID=2014076 RepID=UPI000F4F6448|nr:heptaprenylglyceryl phosphate synthase [Bacillus sp. FJAT-42376]AZB41476.1 heptaprenylglyceryl phosphate synthase [Bacillus sp. FJAT-42376]